MYCNQIKKVEPRFAMFFSRLHMAVLKDFVLFLKQESGSRGSRLEGLKARGMKKAFSQVLQAKSKIKNILNSIYTTLQAEALILIFLYLPSVFSCQSFCPRGSPLKADPHEVSTSTDTNTTSDQWSYFHKNILSLVIDFKTCTV